MTTSLNPSENTLWNYVERQVDPLTGNYHLIFSFTHKASYLDFRRLWRMEYAKLSSQAQAWRRAKQLYRNAGGFRNELFKLGISSKPCCTVSEHFAEITAVFNNTPQDHGRQLRRELCEIRVASKIEAARLRALAQQPRTVA